jgi:hypothetical protein
MLTGGGSLYRYGIMVRLGLSLVVVLVDRLVLYRQKLLISTTVHLQAVVINQSTLAIDKFIVDGKSGWWQHKRYVFILKLTECSFCNY